MEKLLRSAGCFGLTLLAILFALGVTESIKYAPPLQKAVVLFGAVLAAGTVAWLRERLRSGPLEPREAVDEQAILDRVAKRLKEQPAAQPAAASFGRRPEPPPPVKPHEAILKSRQQAIILRQIIPPSHDRAHLSYFGGLPIAPPGFQWPQETKALTFIMQVDCGAIPAEGKLGLMPDEGVIYLFLDLEWQEENAFRILYEPGPANGWNEVPAPENLPHAFDSAIAWKWPQNDEDWPRLLPRWPFDPVFVHGGPLSENEEAMEGTYAWPGTIDSSEAISGIDGAVVPSDYFQVGATISRPFASYPHDWNAIRIAIGLLARRLKREGSRRPYQFKDMADEEFAVLISKVQAELQDWTNRVAAADGFGEVPAGEGDDFWAWLVEREWLTRFVLPDSATLSVEASLTADGDAASRVPGEAIDRVRSRHALAVQTKDGLHINIPDRMLSAPVDVQGTIDERVREFLLLLEFSSNEGLAHYFGEGVYQFWIRPDDLAARRFDRVELSTTAY
jgi:hypothetical protein